MPKSEQHGVALAQQHILRLHISMDQLLIMRVLQGSAHLLHIRQRRLQRQGDAPGMARPQRALRRILHHQKRQPILHIEIKHAHDMGMIEPGDKLRLALKGFRLFRSQRRAQHFDRRQRAQVNMLTQIDLGKAPFA